jgi:hypothetical protein
MADIFISYTAADRDWAFWIAKVQRDNQDGSGASIWMRRGRRACNAGRA